MASQKQDISAHQESSNAECSTSKGIITPRMPGAAKNPDKDLSSSSSIGRIDGSYSRQSMSDHVQKPMRELPSPAALNNLSQRAQDILKKLYSAGEKQGYIDKKSKIGADSKDVPNIIVSSSSLSAIPRAKRKTAPRPEEITAKLNDLVRERNSSEEDPEVAQAM